MPAPDENSPAQKPTADNQLRQTVEQVLEPVTLPKPQKGQVVERVVGLIAERFAGPLPHPKHLAAYEQCSPGAAARIVGMAEYAQKKSEERMDLAVAREYDERSLGLKLGFAALCVLLLAGTIIILAGHEAIGTGLLTFAAVSGVIGMFVHGRSTIRPIPTESRGKKPDDSGAVSARTDRQTPAYPLPCHK